MNSAPIDREPSDRDQSDADPSDADPIAVLQQLVAIESINPDLVPGAGGEAAVAAWCADWMRARGFEVSVLEERLGRSSVVGIIRGSGSGRSLMLNGHLDTVGVASYEGDPFSGELRDDKVFGRGAFDMKGGVAAILVAAARAQALSLAGDVVVTLVADEEFGSLGTEEVLRSVSADAAVIVEPSGLELTLAHRGFAWFELELRGLAAHGSQPERGIDAIAHAGLCLRALDEMRDRLEAVEPHATLGHGTVRVSMISGGEDAATVADTCTLTLERRTLPGQSSDEVEAELRAVFSALASVTPGFSFVLRRLVARAAFEADPTWPIVRSLATEAERVLGHAAATRGEPFWTDAGLVLEAGIPCLVFGVAGGGAHADVEWADAASVEALTDILTGTITDFCR